MYSRCATCRHNGPHELAVRVFSNGTEHVFWRCTRCGSAATPGRWVPHSEVRSTEGLPRVIDPPKNDPNQGSLL